MPEEEAFVAAVKADDPDKVVEMIERNPNLIRMETDAGSPILTATYHGARRVQRLLLSKVSDLDLFEAAAVGDTARMKAVLRREPARVDEANRDGFTPLGLAAFFGHKETVEAVLAQGADVDLVDRSVNENTALDAAVAANHDDVVQVLLDAGASVNVRSAGGFTPLHKAALNGNRGLVELLLARGAEVGAISGDGRTPLALAEARGHAEVAEVLRRHGADG